MKVRLSQSVPEYLRMCLQDTEIRRLAGREVGFTSVDRLWAVLEENSRYSGIANFSSRPVGNEEDVCMALMGAPSYVSQRLLMAYEEQGYLEREDVDSAYSVDNLAQSALYPLARAAYRVPMRLGRKMW